MLKYKKKLNKEKVTGDAVTPNHPITSRSASASTMVMTPIRFAMTSKQGDILNPSLSVKSLMDLRAEEINTVNDISKAELLLSARGTATGMTRQRSESFDSDLIGHRSLKEANAAFSNSVTSLKLLFGEPVSREGQKSLLKFHSMRLPRDAGDHGGKLTPPDDLRRRAALNTAYQTSKFYDSDASGEESSSETPKPKKTGKLGNRKSSPIFIDSSSQFVRNIQKNRLSKRTKKKSISQESLVEEKGKWPRGSSLRRPFNRNTRLEGTNLPDSATQSDTEINKHQHHLDATVCSVSSEQSLDLTRVGTWAVSFEKLLEDPAGLHTFAEFLKKEYSHENIYFWAMCERYKRMCNLEERRTMAREIVERHLCSGASEPVNVDSQARQVAQENLQSPDPFLFSHAQKQIFHLMKFDSYTRFLKSSLYQDCLSRDLKGQMLPYRGDDTMDPELRILLQEDLHISLKKTRSDGDERRRKSLLPWHRKDRSQSKDRSEVDYNHRRKKVSPTEGVGQHSSNMSETSSVRSDFGGSRTSLNSFSQDAMLSIGVGRRAVSRESLTSGDVTSLSSCEGMGRCRVVLPDLSNSVVAIRSGEPIRMLMTRLLERRGLTYSAFDVFLHKGDKPLDKEQDCTILSGQEARLEQRVLFRLDLTNRRAVVVCAKAHKQIGDVLKPILMKYGYKLDLMYIHLIGQESPVNLKQSVVELDGQFLGAQTKEEVKEWGLDRYMGPGRLKKRSTTTLDEITNRVFEDLLKGKSERNFDELGVLDFDTRSNQTDASDHSSTVGATTGSLHRRSSLTGDAETKARRLVSRSSMHEGIGIRRPMGPPMGPPPPPPTIKGGSQRIGNGNHVKQNSEDLYEGLKRAQGSRLDDQRGTEINFDLPEFLKDDRIQIKNERSSQLSERLICELENAFLLEGGILPSHQQAEDLFSHAHPEVWGSLPILNGARNNCPGTELTLEDLDETIQPYLDPPKISKLNTVTGVTPPPLPPKPKVGALRRGPPPRPPSRQAIGHCVKLNDFSNREIPSFTVSRQSQNVNVSFV